MGFDAATMSLFSSPLYFAPNTIALWLCWPQEISEPSLLAQYESVLTHDETQRKNRFHFHKHRHLYLVTRAMEKTLLARYSGIHLKQLTCLRNAYGKPYLCQNGIHPLLYYNLSHTDDLIVMALSKGCELGVDVESTHRIVCREEIVRSYFAKSETDDIQKQATEKEKNIRFYQYWTLKEAYIKALGKGIGSNLESIHFDLTDSKKIKHTDENNLDNTLWQHYLFTTEKGHSIALVLDSREKLKVNMRTMIPMR
ncbi:MAG: 4'-phosphopantetheinyl transferase superfamily protein [Mariprofundaceae bacterium]|nr:4'-phosphopantetheinyl transferase superfamily protein [Mariprofundaceae bacterium]